MSVILFSSKSDVFESMARSYEGLKQFTRQYTYRTFTQEDDCQFYKALRRLYFANVACWLCQYHDNSPLPPSELQEIETFSEIEGYTAPLYPLHGELIRKFLEAWGSLKYNLYTNDGELYKPVDSYEYMEGLARSYGRALAESLHTSEERYGL